MVAVYCHTFWEPTDSISYAPILLCSDKTVEQGPRQHEAAQSIEHIPTPHVAQGAVKVVGGFSLRAHKEYEC